MRRLHPRSPYEKLGGYVHLPRLIDKARLHRKGLLDGYNYKTGALDGNVTAKSIAIEKGGMFSGQLVIGQANLTQGELLSETKAAEKKSESDIPLGAAQPLHAT